ncbi:GNAT family N-acetyltransferase [Nocardia cyriacigeorgica]|uniref:GNAT family N-acetyltransferase n=1 Tax=Nocardia cyriacigeorgica TaxID=135487 RepID=UPI001895427F|nr:GNAT family N-acetyltransferase [Nocardia cyriacigeorgica]MBF6456339.1 GNAT family N-acetyltransferase [Nocardia cyriacigeorgica]MBF6479206.1 GNAT family N-acetyltransferase [Nocardia cyriacigeorgica]MBF6551145.1 GNAT family N-acetyltransferase [Nocardia cyriacigeorgica]
MEERTLTDGTVWLSRPHAADIDRITELCQEPSIGEWVTIPVPYRRIAAEGFLNEIVEPGWADRSPVWAIRGAEHGPVLGMIGFEDRGTSAAEIGFWLGSEYRGNGLMSRAVRLVCGFGFAADGMGLVRISWQAFVGNYASAAVVRRNGFHYEGIARLGAAQRGVRRDSWMSARLATDPATPATDWPAYTFAEHLPGSAAAGTA